MNKRTIKRKKQNSGKRLKSRRVKRSTVKKGGSWWNPFSANTPAPPNSQTVYDKLIEKYNKQTRDMQMAIDVLQKKISKVKSARESDAGITEGTQKLEDLKKKKIEAMKDATGNKWFPDFFKG